MRRGGNEGSGAASAGGGGRGRRRGTPSQQHSPKGPATGTATAADADVAIKPPTASTADEQKRRLCDQHYVLATLPADRRSAGDNGGGDGAVLAVTLCDYPPSTMQAARNLFARCNFVTSVATTDQLPNSSSSSSSSFSSDEGTSARGRFDRAGADDGAGGRGGRNEGGSSSSSSSSVSSVGSQQSGGPRRRGHFVGCVGSVALAGRSNVGKSTLLNAVLRHKGLARASKTPGRTQMLNFFEVRGTLLPPPATTTKSNSNGSSAMDNDDADEHDGDGDGDGDGGDEWSGGSGVDFASAAGAGAAGSPVLLHVVDLPGYVVIVTIGPRARM